MWMRTGWARALKNSALKDWRAPGAPASVTECCYIGISGYIQFRAHGAGLCEAADRATALPMS